ncbi:MAG: hypothetical protein K1X29_03915 [Bdellovibrionales bacterium]|nr:hypothetical protein [Bdellovibrionales bacterium]
MGQFQIERQQLGQKTLFTLKGPIDEDAILSGDYFKNISEIELDLAQIQSINSCGIREWIKWLSHTQSSQKITFKNCPKLIVDQINMVAGFLPVNGVVESFFVPYFSEDSGEEKMILFRRGFEFDGSNIQAPDNVKGTSGELMEMDVIESKYFNFLKK